MLFVRAPGGAVRVSVCAVRAAEAALCRARGSGSGPPRGGERVLGVRTPPVAIADTVTTIVWDWREPIPRHHRHNVPHAERIFVGGSRGLPRPPRRVHESMSVVHVRSSKPSERESRRGQRPEELGGGKPVPSGGWVRLRRFGHTRAARRAHGAISWCLPVKERVRVLRRRAAYAATAHLPTHIIRRACCLTRTQCRCRMRRFARLQALVDLHRVPHRQVAVGSLDKSRASATTQLCYEGFVDEVREL